MFLNIAEIDGCSTSKKEGVTMPACPHCHIFKGLWSPLSAGEDGQFVCKVNPAHRFTRDGEGNFHSISGS